MAKFDINYADRPVNVRSTAAYARPQTEVYEALSQAGQSIFKIGSQLQEQKETLEISEGQRKISEQYNTALEMLTGDEDNDNKILEQFQSGIGGIRSDNARVNRALTLYRNQVMPNIEKSLGDRHRTLLRDNVHSQFQAEGQTYLARGELDNYQTLLERRLATKDITQAEYDSLNKSAFVDSLLEQARDKIASNDPEQTLIAKKMLSVVPTLNMATTEKKEYAKKLLSIAKRNGDALADEANKQLTDLMIQGSLSSEDVMLRRSALPDNDYQSWAKIALQPLDKRGSIIQETEFKTKALDVWRGTLSRNELEAQIRTSLSDPTGINDKQYAAIYDDLNREVRSYQAQDMKSYSIETTRLILGKDANVMSFDALGNMTIDINKLLSPNEEFERKMHFIDLYNRGMSDFLASNPEVSKKDLYVKSQELKATYLQASKTGKIPETIPTVKTRADYDALAPGTVYIAPDGQRRRK